MYRTEDLINDLQPLVSAVDGAVGVTRLVLFGSFARGTQNITSDIDIAVAEKVFGYVSRYEFA